MGLDFECSEFEPPLYFDLFFSFQVEDSMDSLENVVRERNRDYYELETADSGKFFLYF